MTDTQTIKDRVDIVQLIQEYIPLKKAGANWKAPCPFHNEKSPSFMVHPEKQIWHCFGCQKGGDIFSFVQAIEGLEFSETLKLLATRAGVALSTSAANEGASHQRSRIIDINDQAARFFHHVLLEIPTSAPARDYLAKRQLKAETIEEWQIGYIPDQWDLLTKYLLKKGCAIDDLLAAGLTIKRDDADPRSGRGFYDRFRGRIMFPIWDVHGSVIGFTGRVLVETEHSGGKYVNTPQTLAYDKSRVLYGLNKAKIDIKSKNQAVLVEGQMDVIACHQAGMKQVIAASGTALTKDQIRLIKRYTENIAMAFDADAAGENAGRRGIELAVEEGLKVKVIQIPPGFAKDADECIKKDPAIWFKTVEEAREVMVWYFELAERKFKVTEPSGRQGAAIMLLTEISRLPHAVERDYWFGKLANFLQIERSVLAEELSALKRANARLNRPISSSNPAPSSPPISTLPTNPDERRFLQLLTTWWGLIFAFPALFPEAIKQVGPEVMVGTKFFDLYDFWQTAYTTNTINLDQLALEWAARGKTDEYTVLSFQAGQDYPEGLTQAVATTEIRELSVRLKDAWKKNRRRAVLFILKEAEQKGDAEAARKAFSELQQL